MSAPDQAGELATITHAVNPVTGELVNVRDATGRDLADALEQLNDYYDELARYKGELVGEVARRADARNTRKVELDGIVFEVNAPTQDVYNLGELRAELEPFVKSGVLDESVLTALTRYPPPKRPPPEVDKRELNKLWKSENRELLAALARARRRDRPKRTAKIVERALDATAIEETS